jgi:hypothetical protein
MSACSQRPRPTAPEREVPSTAALNAPHTAAAAGVRGQQSCSFEGEVVAGAPGTDFVHGGAGLASMGTGPAARMRTLRQRPLPKRRLKSTPSAAT